MTRVVLFERSSRVRTAMGCALLSAGYEVDRIDSRADLADALSDDPPGLAVIEGAAFDDAADRVPDWLPSEGQPALLVVGETAAGIDSLQTVTPTVERLPRPTNDRRGLGAFLEQFETAVERLASRQSSQDAVAARTATTVQVPSGGAAGVITGGAPGPSGGPTPLESTEDPVPTDDDCAESATDDHPTIVVGASTGGPRVLKRMLAELPRQLGAAVFIVQHMPASFTGRFAERLDARSAYDVRHATDGARIEPGTAVLARGDRQLEVERDPRGTLHVRLEASGDAICPSIDVTMKAVASAAAGPLCGVLLTGMGNDGAEGIQAISAAGGHTVAQDEATSHVFGIPGAGIETGAVETVVPAEQLTGQITSALRRQS